jgi:hypothetical protein
MERRGVGLEGEMEGARAVGKVEVHPVAAQGARWRAMILSGS